MGRIHRLPLHLANQIAAGEVVERPASVVKELVENALDAGSTRIAVAIELGGKKLIRVEDDGEGMEPEDAQLAVERHATSKISRPDDLGAIRTLGFRGEALPSIASVSHFVLRTRARGADSGTEVRIDGGQAASIREVGTREGTCIEVADLFFNLPARRKFLKSDVAESTQVSRLMTQLALGYPEVGWSLTSGGRRLLECPPAAGLAERFFQLFGERPGSAGAPQGGGGDLDSRLRGRARRSRSGARLAERLRQPPHRQGPHHRARDFRGVQRRDDQGAQSRRCTSSSRFRPTGSTSTCIPTKAEVRFLEQSLVHEVLRRALADTLGRGPAPELQLSPFEGRPGEPQPMTIPGVLAGATIGSRWTPAPYPIDRPIPSAAPAVDPSAWQHRPDGSRWSQPQAGEAGTMQSGSSGAIDTGEMTPDTGEIKPMIPLGQFRDTYIVAIDDEGIAIIDQHVAHERVLFELVMEKLTVGRAREPAAAHADRARALAAAAAGAGAECRRARAVRAAKSRTSAATA